ncbi:MAG TPA: ribosome maturation factor RimM [Acidimicrobiia bacterium]|nr:ribosome maturation factor RimM [Acidimicrobiia bacterium]
MLVGRIGRPHGLHGYLAVHPETDNPQRFAAGAAVNTDDGRQLTVERSQQRPGSLLVRFREVSDRTGAEALTGEFLFIDSSVRRDLQDDEFWPDELIGFRVRSVDGADLGRVDDVVEGAAQYRLVVRRGPVTFEVPFVAALVPDVDRESATVVVADLPGLVPES